MARLATGVLCLSITKHHGKSGTEEHAYYHLIQMKNIYKNFCIEYYV